MTISIKKTVEFIRLIIPQVQVVYFLHCSIFFAWKVHPKTRCVSSEFSSKQPIERRFWAHFVFRPPGIFRGASIRYFCAISCSFKIPVIISIGQFNFNMKCGKFLCAKQFQRPFMCLHRLVIYFVFFKICPTMRKGSVADEMVSKEIGIDCVEKCWRTQFVFLNKISR